MSIEAWKLNEEEKKKKNLWEKEIKNLLKKEIEFKKIKKKIDIEVEAEDKIFNLKELVQKWIISKETAKKISNWENINKLIIKKIFEKINQIEDIKNINKYIPKKLRITNEDYLKALHDNIFRIEIITKLNTSLMLLSNQINSDWILWLNLFSWFLTILDKNLIMIQENTIDIKESLIKIDNKKIWKKNKKSIWQIILDFLKEIFY